MKKLLLTALVAVTLVASAFAAPVTTVNSFIDRSFTEDFKNATEIKWETTNTYAKASFVVDNVRTEAFYEFDGELIGSAQAISLEELPVAAKRSFAKKYGDYTVKQAIRFDGKDETAYYISAENDKQSVILKATGGGTSIEKVTKIQ